MSESLLKVRISVYSDLRQIIGKPSLVLDLRDDSTLQELIYQLNVEYGEGYRMETGKSLTDALEKDFNIIINGRRVNLPSDMRLKMKENSEVVILRPVKGGQVSRCHTGNPC